MAIPTICLAETQVSNPGEGPDIYAAWTKSGDPDLGTDFTVDFTDGANPDVELLIGDTTWNIRSDVGGSPGNIGDITLDPTVNDDNFTLTILNGSNPGADDVGSIGLTAASWTGFSSIAGGNITGDLSGPATVVKDSGSSGGEVSMLIQGDASGDITAYKIVALDVWGDVSGDIACAILSTSLQISGNLSGDIDVSDKIDASVLYVYKAVTSTATVTIGDLVNYPVVRFGLTSGDFDGDLVLDNGVPSTAIVLIHGELTRTGSIDLTNDDAVGNLVIYGGGSGLITNGAAASGVTLASGSTKKFSGQATFSTVTGFLGTVSGADIDGTVTVTGDISGGGTVTVADDLLSGGKVAINGDITSGGISISGDADGDIDVDGDVDAGSIAIGGTLKARGRILVDGLFSASMTVGEETVALSLIHLLGGLGEGGTVTINSSEGAYDANGAIHVGGISADPLPAVTFDGLITITDGTSSGGDLDGTITVVGCHATADDLDICIEGGNGGGNVSIDQSGCANQVTWSCP